MPVHANDKTARRSASGAATGSAFFDGTRRDPVDKTAAMCMARGVRYNNEPKKILQHHWENPPPMRKVPKFQPNLIHRRNGRLTVVGLYHLKPLRWVVRCDCGDYELRKTKAINNPNNFGDRCYKCRVTSFEKKDYAFRKQGVELDQREL